MNEEELAAVERIGGALAQAGMTRLPARVFAALLVDDDARMTATELTEALGVSAAAVSGAVAYLERVSMLRRERERGSRRDIYVVDDDAWHGAMMRRDQLYAPIKTSLDQALATLGSDAGASRRLALSSDFLAFLEEELGGLADKWERRKASAPDAR